MKKFRQLLEYLALAKAIDNPEGAEVLADASAEILEELVTEHAEKEGIVITSTGPMEEDLDIEEEIPEEDDIIWDEDEDEEDEEEIMSHVSLWEGDEDEDEEEDEEEDDEDETIVEIDEDEEEEPVETEEEVPAVNSRAARRAISIANRLYASGDSDSEKLAKNILKFVVKK